MQKIDTVKQLSESIVTMLRRTADTIEHETNTLHYSGFEWNDHLTDQDALQIIIMQGRKVFREEEQCINQRLKEGVLRHYVHSTFSVYV